jgi:hypothetical protein
MVTSRRGTIAIFMCRFTNSVFSDGLRRERERERGEGC